MERVSKKPLGARGAFTLIELLVSISIISIVALLALDNYLESTTRAKVARTKNDMRVIAGAMEAYHVDNSTYLRFAVPRDGATQVVDQVVVPMTKRLAPLSTPISYVTKVPVDIFETVATMDGSPLVFFDTYDYVDVNGLREIGSNKGAGVSSGGLWRLSSAGPDRIQSFGGDLAIVGRAGKINSFGVDYDPTNGSVSAGDIVRVGPPSDEGLAPAIRRTGGYQELFRDIESPVGGPPGVQ